MNNKCGESPIEFQVELEGRLAAIEEKLGIKYVPAVVQPVAPAAAVEKKTKKGKPAK